MKFIVVFVALIALASAVRRVKKPIESYFTDFAGEEDIHLITGEDEAPPTNFVGDVMKAQTTSLKTLTGSKKFNYNFETQNGIKIASIGKLKDSKTFIVSGSYTYTGANGKRYRVRYTADEFGYHPVTEEDNEPEVEITPAPTPAPVTAPKFTPFNQFGNFGSNARVGKQFGGQNGQNTGFNGYNYNNGNGNGQGNGFGGQNNRFGNQYGNQNGQFGGQNGFGNNNGQGNGFGGPRSFNNRNGFGGAPNGFNTVNQFGFDRTGKSLQQNELIFNKDFVTANVAKLDTPNRLYLPAARTYLPPQ